MAFKNIGKAIAILRRKRDLSQAEARFLAFQNPHAAIDGVRKVVERAIDPAVRFTRLIEGAAPKPGPRQSGAAGQGPAALVRTILPGGGVGRWLARLSSLLTLPSCVSTGSPERARAPRISPPPRISSLNGRRRREDGRILLQHLATQSKGQ